jgi:hypothetical protein
MPKSDQARYPLGYIRSTWVPAWVGLSANDFKYKVILPPLPPTYKYIPYYYVRKKGDHKYVPKFIIVDKDYKFRRKIQPLQIPIYIRADTLGLNGVRPIVRIDMPVIYDPREILPGSNNDPNNDTDPKKNDSTARKPKKVSRMAPLPGQMQIRDILDEGERNKNEKDAKKKALEPEWVLKKICMRWKMGVV